MSTSYSALDLIEAGRRQAFLEVQDELSRLIGEHEEKGWLTHVTCLLETSIAIYNLQKEN